MAVGNQDSVEHLVFHLITLPGVLRLAQPYVAQEATLPVAAYFSGKTSESATPSATGVATPVADLLQDVATLKERVAGLERENDLLRERLKIADAALEREQLQPRGFWSNLSQKLLGSGKN